MASPTALTVTCLDPDCTHVDQPVTPTDDNRCPYCGNDDFALTDTCPQCGASNQDGNASPLYDTLGLCADCGEARDAAEQDTDDEPTENDYELHTRFDAAGDPTYQLVERFRGRVVHQAPTMPELRTLLDASSYYPNVWWISDHGNAHLVTDWT